jgi:putative glutamine amidotransferase
MSTAPLIGVTSYRNSREEDSSITYVVSNPYIQSVIQAGGIPVVLTAATPLDRLTDLLARLDGVVLTGGSDIDPNRFNGRHHARIYEVDPLRDAFEISLVQQAAQSGLPFLAICRGIQVVNVALGGTLFTDIADQAPHPLRHDWYPNIPRSFLAHRVQVTAGSQLAEILGGEDVGVNSLHHQAVELVAPGLKTTAQAPDGIVEAVELEGHPFGLGVQWHPESLQHLPEHRALFKALVTAAQR